MAKSPQVVRDRRRSCCRCQSPPHFHFHVYTAILLLVSPTLHTPLLCPSLAGALDLVSSQQKFHQWQHSGCTLARMRRTVISITIFSFAYSFFSSSTIALKIETPPH